MGGFNEQEGLPDEEVHLGRSQESTGEHRDILCPSFQNKDKLESPGYMQEEWAFLDLNQGPRPYQGRALTN